MLRQRVLTALGLVALIAVVLLLLPPALAVAALAAMLLAGAWEWSALAGLQGIAVRLAYVGLCAAAMAGLWLLAGGVLALGWLLAVTMAGWVAIFLWMLLAPAAGPRWLAGLAGLWALAPAWLALSTLYLQAGHGRELVVFALLLVWAADIGAYFAGRRYGRVKLAPRVSPNKTWEGVLGGLAGSLLVAAAGAAWFGQPVLAFLSLCVAVVLASIVGDLAESMFKRQRGLKDSGSLLPGHGGVLDRIDSLTSALPLLALGLSWLGLVA